jgi:hypothetical protein
MMKITAREFILAVAIAIMGFVFSSREWILSLDKLTPIDGLITYYIIMYGALIILSSLGLTVFNVKIENPIQTFGLLLITFAFFITIDWESPYIQYITNRNIENVSPVYFQAEDGAVWYFWSNQGIKDINTLRIFTYVLTPFVLVLIGSLLVGKVVI